VVETAQHVLGDLDWRLAFPQEVQPAVNAFVSLKDRTTAWTTGGVGSDCLRFGLGKPAENGRFQLTGRRMGRLGRL